MTKRLPRPDALRALLLALAVCALPACKVASVGTCGSDGDCGAGNRCDTTVDPSVCVVSQTGCFPACAGGLVCKSGTCVAEACTPPCDAQHVCNVSTFSCDPARALTVAVTSPAADAFAGPSLQVTADARGPAAITAVRFELRRGSSVLAQSAGAAAPSSADPANWAATLHLAAVAEGPAQLVAIASATGSVAESAGVAVTIDLTAPAIAIVTDGAQSLYAGGASASIVATVTDSGAGVDPASVKLTLVGTTHAPVLAVLSGTTATFTVAVDDSVAAAGSSKIVALRIDAADKVGNAASLANDPKEVLLVDRTPPTGTVAADAAWHGATETVTVKGTIADSGAVSGVGGGRSAVTLLQGTAVLATTAIAGSGTSAAWTAQLPLAGLPIARGEAPLLFSVQLTDRAGNATTLPASINVDNDGPTISGIAIAPGPEYVDTTTGRGYYRADAGALAVTATILDPSGVDRTSGTACLRTDFEDGGCRAGTTADGGFWRFSLPRPGPASPLDGTAAVNFTLSAQDLLAAADGGSDRARHTGTTAPQRVYFDNQAPSINIVSDNVHYRRTLPDGGGDLVAVSAVIADPTSVADGTGAKPTLTAAGVTSPYVARDGGLYTFSLDARLADGGAEAPLAFIITAQDGLAHVATAGSTRFIDDAPPAATVSIYSTSFTGPPPGPGVTYPAGITGTGWLGTNFLYDETVHVAGTVADPSGIGSSAALRIDGVEGINGGTPIAINTGSALRSLGCSDGVTTCTFDVTVAWNAAGNGAFHPTGQLMAFPFSGDTRSHSYPQGPMRAVIVAADKAQAGGVVVPLSGETATAADVSRVRWYATLPGLSQINGLAVHPSGDVIATGSAASSTASPADDTVVALFNRGTIPDGGTTPNNPVHWSFGGAVPLLDILAPAAIGDGDGGTAAIYAATSDGGLYALAPDGGTLWHADSLGTFATAPLVAQAQVSNGSSLSLVEEVVAATNDTAATSVLRGAYLRAGSSTPATVSIASDNADAVSAPMLFDGGIYYGTSSAVDRVDFADGGFANPTTALAGNAFGSPITDGTAIYIANKLPLANAAVYRLDETLAASNNWPVAPQYSVRDSFILAAGGADLVLSLVSFEVVTIATASGTQTTLGTLGNAGHSPLAGSAGNFYVPRTTGFLNVLLGATAVWEFDPPGIVTPAATMDCQGNLFLGSGKVVYSFITDDSGLADSPWPAARRDARNTGNASAPRYGVRTSAGCTQ